MAMPLPERTSAAPAHAHSIADRHAGDARCARHAAGRGRAVMAACGDERRAQMKDVNASPPSALPIARSGVQKQTGSSDPCEAQLPMRGKVRESAYPRAHTKTHVLEMRAGGCMCGEATWGFTHVVDGIRSCRSNDLAPGCGERHQPSGSRCLCGLAHAPVAVCAQILLGFAALLVS